MKVSIALLHERYKYLTLILAVIFLDLIGNRFARRRMLFTLRRGQATLRLWWPRRGTARWGPINGEPSRRYEASRHTESPIRGAALSRRSETTHPFLIRGSDIGFTSTQGSSYGDACATYPISGAAQESDFSLSLHRASSTLPPPLLPALPPYT